MTASIRWLALLPDPVTGLDEPIQVRGQALQWYAPDRVKATELVRAELRPAVFRLASIISAVDWSARQQLPQRPKAVIDPTHMHRMGFIVRNASQRCLCCGEAVKPSALYCPEHRTQKARKQYADARGMGG